MTLKELKKWKCRAEKCVEIYKNNGKDTSTAKVTIPADKFLDLTDTAIKALEQQPCEDCISRNNKRTICTDGLEEGIRCAMCTNPMANDRGCDGGCVVNESMYQNVLNVIKKQILEQEPCEDAVTRQAVLDTLDKMDKALDTDRTVENYKELLTECYKVLPSATPKEKSEYEHDHEVVKAYNDGQVYILDRIRAEIERLQKEQSNHYGNETETARYDAYDDCLDVINKYRGE